MKIKILQTGQELEGDPNKSVLQICTEQGVQIRSVCKGVPSCAECRVFVATGENNVLPPQRAELNLIGTSYYLDGRRLSCQMRCFGDVTIDLRDHQEIKDQNLKKLRGFQKEGAQSSVAKQDSFVLSQNPGPNSTPKR